MLPVYNAIAFNTIIPKGGRTKPWVVLAATPGGVLPFVVKMFKSQLIQDRDSVTNEVLGNVLAREFDLPVPGAALIKMDEQFRMSIRDQDALMAYDEVDDRIKFGSALIEGNQLFSSSSFSRAQASRMIDLGSLFAFDVLIRNSDRNIFKPNLLVKSKSAFLIDHELGFEIDANTISHFRIGTLDNSRFANHLTHRYLSNYIIQLNLYPF